MEDFDEGDLMVARNIKRARVMTKTSLSELSSRTGISEKKLRELESGKKYQETVLLEKIADALNVGMDVLFQIPDDEDVDERIRFLKNKILRGDKMAAIEIARYKTNGIVDLVDVLSINRYNPPSEVIDSVTTVKALGEKLANEWLTPQKTLTQSLEEQGIFVIKIPIETSKFNGLFIRRNGVSVIAIYDHISRKTNRQKIFFDLSHELCHAILSRQSITEEHEETLCNAFAETFSNSALKLGIDLGNFDFIERKAVDAWEKEEISCSKAAEVIGISLYEFFRRYRYESAT